MLYLLPMHNLEGLLKKRLGMGVDNCALLTASNLSSSLP